MNKELLIFFSTMILSLTASSTHAVLHHDATLHFYAAPSPTTSQPVSGSWLSMEISPGIYTYIPTVSVQGIRLGDVQAPGSPPVDMVLNPFGGSAYHGTIGTPVTVNTDDGAGNVTLDMSGWFLYLNDSIMDLGQGADASMACDSTCEYNDSYTLDYTTVIPSGPFSGITYAIHLEGTISAIPVPASIWLFGSGLMVLIKLTKKND